MRPRLTLAGAALGAALFGFAIGRASPVADACTCKLWRTWTLRLDGVTPAGRGLVGDELFRWSHDAALTSGGRFWSEHVSCDLRAHR